MSGALVAVVAVGAYGLGRVYPPLRRPSEGTIAPAERYVSSQVGAGDVTLGDTSIPPLMQTDAFEMMVKDPNFLALARDPNFAALAQNSAGDGLHGRQRPRIRRAGQGPAGLRPAAEAGAGRLGRFPGREANSREAQLFASMSANAAGFEALSPAPGSSDRDVARPQAFVQFAKDPQGFANALKNPQAMPAMARDVNAFAKLAANARDSRWKSRPMRGTFNAIAANANALGSLAKNANALQIARPRRRRSLRMAALPMHSTHEVEVAFASHAQAYSQLALQPQLFSVMSRYPNVFASLANHPQVLANMAANARGYERFAKDPQAFIAAMRNPQGIAANSRDAAALRSSPAMPRPWPISRPTRRCSTRSPRTMRRSTHWTNSQLLAAATSVNAIANMAANAQVVRAASRDVQGLAAAARGANAFISQATAHGSEWPDQRQYDGVDGRRSARRSRR